MSPQYISDPIQLISALAITAASVRIIIGPARESCHPVDCIASVTRHPDGWRAKLRPSGQVKWIMRDDALPEPIGFVWQHCYRTTEAPAVQPSPEWLNSRLGR